MKRMSVMAPLLVLLLAFNFPPRALAANQSWVLPADCQAEQAAVRANGDVYTSSHTTEQSISEAMEFPWIFRFDGKVTGRLMSPQELRERGDLLLQESRKKAEDYRRNANSRSAAMVMRLGQLQACFYQVAAERSSGNATAPKPTAAPIADCSADARAKVNASLQDIDSRVGVFMASPLGRSQGEATPAMQVIMWGTRQQVDVIKLSCPGSVAFNERLADLESSFAAARKACNQLQSRPNVCGPVAPEQIIASHEKAQGAADLTKQQMGEGMDGVNDVPPPGVNPAKFPLADFMGYYKGLCLERGFSPVTYRGCLICGNPEGTLGAGFQWRQCHASSQGVSAAR